MTTYRDLIWAAALALIILGGCSGPGTISSNAGDVEEDAGGCPAGSALVGEECLSEQTVPCKQLDPPDHSQYVETEVTITYAEDTGWSKPAECDWECDADYDEEGQACLNEQVVNCNDGPIPDNAHHVDVEVTITYTDASGWTAPDDCDWECDSDFDLVEEACINEQLTNCDDGPIPDNAHHIDGAVTVTFTDADGWATPDDCDWECDDDFDLVDEACINEQTVPCADVTPPEHAQQIDSEVTIAYTDAEGWSDPTECAWECDDDYDLLDEACINEQTVPCADTTPPDNAHQVDVDVTIIYTDADGWSSPTECAWECDPDFDLLGGDCLHEQMIPCAPVQPPANAHQIAVDVTITYTDANGWSDPEACAWECDPDFDLDAESCINEQLVDCADIEPPANAHQTLSQVTITYTDANGWTDPDNCGWDCDADFDLVEQACINEKVVDCADIQPPLDAHQLDEEVTISFTDADGWTTPEDCDWACNADHDLVEGNCIDLQMVGCADIVAPLNAHQVGGAVQITYTDDGGWTDPADCKWECNTDFDLVADACIDVQSVKCADIEPPLNAHQVDLQVQITYSDANGWTDPVKCGWECNDDHDFYDGFCIQERNVGCSDIEPPLHAHQVDGTVTITYTDADGWTAPAGCGWECDTGYLTADDVACDVCDNDLGYWAFDLDEDCSPSNWESQGTWYGPGGELDTASDGEGGAFLTWSYQTGGKPDIALMRLGPDGAPAAGWPAEGVLACAAEGSQDNPAVIDDGAGGAFVSWRDKRGTSPAIYVQHILADGTTADGWPADGLLVHQGELGQESRDPRMTTDGAGGAYITWWGYTGTKSSAFVMVRRVTPDGTYPNGWESGLILTEVGGHSYPHAVSDGEGGAYIAWSEIGCRVTRVAANGSMADGWGGMGIAVVELGAAFHCGLPASDAKGGVLIPWAHSTAGNVGYDVFVQRVDGAGSGLWTDANPYGGVKVSGGQFHEDQPRVAPDGNGGAFLVWQDRREADSLWDGTKQEIYAGHILPNGARDAEWPATWLQISTTEDGYHATPGIVPDGAGGALIVWERSDAAVGNEMVRLTRITSSADFVAGWDVDGLTLAHDAAAGAHDQLVVTDGEFGAIVSWVRESIDGNEVRALRVFGNGTLPLK